MSCISYNHGHILIEPARSYLGALSGEASHAALKGLTADLRLGTKHSDGRSCLTMETFHSWLFSFEEAFGIILPAVALATFKKGLLTSLQGSDSLSVVMYSVREKMYM